METQTSVYNPQITSKGAGIIALNFEGITFQETERIRSMIHTLFDKNFFSMRSGSMTVHFDSSGTIQAMDIIRKWRREEDAIKKQVERY